MSGAALVKARDLYHFGYETYRASRWDYFLNGVSSAVDLSSTLSKVVTVGGVVLLGGLAIASAPAAVVVGGVLVAGTALYGLGKAIKNGVEIALADGEGKTKENLADLGEAFAISLLSVPFALKGVLAAKNGFQTLKVSTRVVTPTAEPPRPIPTEPSSEVTVGIVIEPSETQKRTMGDVFDKAADRLRRGEIGHLDINDPQLIGSMVMTPGGEFPPEITLGITGVNIAEKAVLVSGGPHYGTRWLPLDRVRDIHATIEAMVTAVMDSLPPGRN